MRRYVIIPINAHLETASLDHEAIMMGVEPVLTNACARRTLRRLELEAYASVVSAFRAQGPLTVEKKESLEQLCRHMGISAERHRAEIRRAVNDELLTSVAGCISGVESDKSWRKEGQKLPSTNPRFVSRHMTHLPSALTSATVSAALGLQGGRGELELGKSTSTQVQNALKFIISQNPLNAKVQTGAGKSQGGPQARPTSPTESPPAVGKVPKSKSSENASTEPLNLDGVRSSFDKKTDPHLLERLSPQPPTEHHKAVTLSSEDPTPQLQAPVQEDSKTSSQDHATEKSNPRLKPKPENKPTLQNGDDTFMDAVPDRTETDTKARGETELTSNSISSSETEPAQQEKMPTEMTSEAEKPVKPFLEEKMDATPSKAETEAQPEMKSMPKLPASEIEKPALHEEMSTGAKSETRETTTLPVEEMEVDQTHAEEEEDSTKRSQEESRPSAAAEQEAECIRDSSTQSSKVTISDSPRSELPPKPAVPNKEDSNPPPPLATEAPQSRFSLRDMLTSGVGQPKPAPVASTSTTANAVPPSPLSSTATEKEKAPTVSAPPVSTPPVSTPIVSAPPVSTPPVSTPIVSAPPVSTPIVSAPPVSAPIVSAPPVSAPIVSAPPVSTLPVSTPIVSTPPVSAPPVSTPIVSTPPVSAPPVSTPIVSAPPVSTPPVSAPPVSSTSDKETATPRPQSRKRPASPDSLPLLPPAKKPVPPLLAPSPHPPALTPIELLSPSVDTDVKIPTRHIVTPTNPPPLIPASEVVVAASNAEATKMESSSKSALSLLQSGVGTESDSRPAVASTSVQALPPQNDRATDTETRISVKNAAPPTPIPIAPSILKPHDPTLVPLSLSAITPTSPDPHISLPPSSPPSTSMDTLVQALCSEADATMSEESASLSALAAQVGLDFLPNLLNMSDLLQLMQPELNPTSQVMEPQPQPDTPLYSPSLNESPSETTTPVLTVFPQTPTLLPPPLSSVAQAQDVALTSGIISPLSSVTQAGGEGVMMNMDLSTVNSMQPLASGADVSQLASSMGIDLSVLASSESTDPFSATIDLSSLATDDAELLEGIPPELQETIQALARLDERSSAEINVPYQHDQV